jgi:hypothetical protein
MFGDEQQIRHEAASDYAADEAFRCWTNRTDEQAQNTWSMTMLKVATLAIAMMVSTAAFAQVITDPYTGKPVEQMQATAPVPYIDFCTGDLQPNYCPGPVADINLARLMFDKTPLGPAQTFVQYGPFVAQREDGEAAPIGLVGEPYPPGIEQQPGGIGSDYVAQLKADRAWEKKIEAVIDPAPELPPLTFAKCPQPTPERDAACNPDQPATDARK